LKKESNRRQNGAFQKLSRDGTRKRLIFQRPAGAVSAFQKDLFLENGLNKATLYGWTSTRSSAEGKSRTASVSAGAVR
jgi:hypothetical protein